MEQSVSSAGKLGERQCFMGDNRETDPKDSFIESLIKQNEDLKLDLQATYAVLVDMKEELDKSKDSLAELTNLRSEMATLRAELQQERKECKLLERKCALVQELLDSTNKNSMTSKSQNSKRK